MNRRDFIKYSSATLPAFFFSESKTSTKAILPSHKICFLGSESWRDAFGTNYQPNQASSTYTELNVPDGKLEQVILPIENGHSISSISDSNTQILMCPYLGSRSLVYDRDKKKIVKIFHASENFLFSGHSCTSENFIFMPMKHQLFTDNNKNEGKVLVLEKKSLKKIDEISSHGIWPHDIAFFDETLAITHTGANGPLTIPKKFQYDNVSSNLVLIKDNKTHQKFSTSGFSPSHLSYSPASKMIFFNSVQWLNINIENINSFEKVESFQFSLSERINKRISNPEPLLVLNLENKKLKTKAIPPSLGRRAVEIITDDSRKCVYATFSHSDVLVMLDWNGDILRSRKGFDLGLSELRAIDFLGDDYLVVSGKYRGVAIVDRSSLEPILRYDVPNYNNTHLSIL